MEKAIKLAIEKGGYKSYKATRTEYGEVYWDGTVVLDPLFWQALAKALEREWFEEEQLPIWKYWAMEYFDLVLTGGDTEKFWKEILT